MDCGFGLMAIEWGLFKFNVVEDEISDCNVLLLTNSLWAIRKGSFI